MSKFIIRDTLPCYVTWTYEVEAESQEVAERAYTDGEATTIGEPEIGDCIDGVPSQTECYCADVPPAAHDPAELRPESVVGRTHPT